jgi:hypothetical protein
MAEIFLSASVPIIGRGHYYETANPFLIQTAVRELVIAVIRNHRIVWGGHPAITPMIWTICRDLGRDYSRSVVLYQSRFFREMFPEENVHFRNVVYVDAVDNDREASLLRMREAMLSRPELRAAVFIGGMEGVEAEHQIFRRFHPNERILLVPAPGGAARSLAEQALYVDESRMSDVDFARLFETELVAPLG